MSNRKPTTANHAKAIALATEARAMPETDHPDYLAGTFDESALDGDGFTPAPDGPLPGPFPGPLPGPIPLPIPFPPIRFCSAVSGRYRLAPPLLPPFPRLNLLSVTVRVDVDRFLPQNRISIEVSRLFPRSTAHAIAEVTSDQCLGINRRRIRAKISYRDGNAALIPGDDVLFEASRGRGIGYGAYSLTLSGPGLPSKTYQLAQMSQRFDPVEFEVDRVDNAGDAVTDYDTASHPNRPADLPLETLTLESVYRRSGFDVTMSPNTTVIPTADAGANGTWSDGEMHNAMVTYWSRFADKPQWALWVLYAAQHDIGHSLGGIMFDDIGSNHRQGTAIFTDSFIQDAPAADPNPVAWRRRMVFWTAVHEMGHAFNLAHAWQKSLGTAQGQPGDPWIPLADQPESRSFMNYPFFVSGGESAFFSDFRFRFSDDELVFMRHAPRRFVQMGNSDWFVNHGFEAPNALMQSGNWTLNVRPNRDLNTYSFLEPVVMELKLTNSSGQTTTVDDHLLADGRHVSVIVQREGGQPRRWRPLITRCHKEDAKALKSGESIYGSHAIAASTEGWLIDEPGFYKVQAAVDMDGEIVVSNVLRLFVAPPKTDQESRIAPDYFTEDVGRALVFGGAPALVAAEATLAKVVAECPKNPAAVHAAVALSAPRLRDYKILEAGAGRADLSIRSQSADVEEAAKAQQAALLDAPEKSAETMGHICYFEKLDELAAAMASSGDDKGAKKVVQGTVAAMKSRDVLPSVIQATERKLAKMK